MVSGSEEAAALDFDYALADVALADNETYRQTDEVGVVELDAR